MREKKPIAIFYLFRAFESSLIAASGVLEFILLKVYDVHQLLLIFLGAFFMMGGIYAWNDSLDIKEDKINHPERPIPSGAFTIAQAKVLGTISFIISSIFLAWLSMKILMLGIIAAFVGVMYSKTTKRIIFGKNLTVIMSALIGAATVAFVISNSLKTISLAFLLSIVLLLFGYEILKDMQDIFGDHAVGITTIPHLVGWDNATLIAGTTFTLSCVAIGIYFQFSGLLFESFVSYITAVLLIPIFFILHTYPQKISLVRMVAILVVGIALNTVALSIYIREK